MACTLTLTLRFVLLADLALAAVAATTRRHGWLSRVQVRGGTLSDPAFDDENNDYDAYNDEQEAPPPSRHGRRDHSQQRRNRKPPPLWKRVASQSAKLSGQALSATARFSGSTAYNLVSPKHVEWEELVGNWRLDQWMYDEAVPMSVELTTRPPTVWIAKGTSKQPHPCHFTPSVWPRSAKLEFEVGEDLLYTCTIQRKLADTSVLKLRGKIYEQRWGGRKVLIGTFIGRRRMKLLNEEDEESTLEDEGGGYDDMSEMEEEEEVEGESDGEVDDEYK